MPPLSCAWRSARTLLCRCISRRRVAWKACATVPWGPGEPPSAADGGLPLPGAALSDCAVNLCDPTASSSQKAASLRCSQPASHSFRTSARAWAEWGACISIVKFPPPGANFTYLPSSPWQTKRTSLHNACSTVCGRLRWEACPRRSALAGNAPATGPAPATSAGSTTLRGARGRWSAPSSTSSSAGAASSGHAPRRWHRSPRREAASGRLSRATRRWRPEASAAKSAGKAGPSTSTTHLAPEQQ